MNTPSPDPGPSGVVEKQETTVINGGLFVFYSSCAIVSIGAAVAASGWLVYQSVFWSGLGGFCIAAGSIGCLLGLRSARKSRAD